VRGWGYLAGDHNDATRLALRRGEVDTGRAQRLRRCWVTGGRCRFCRSRKKNERRGDKCRNAE
jgi:hypothetical protein